MSHPVPEAALHAERHINRRIQLTGAAVLQHNYGANSYLPDQTGPKELFLTIVYDLKFRVCVKFPAITFVSHHAPDSWKAEIRQI